MALVMEPIRHTSKYGTLKEAGFAKVCELMTSVDSKPWISASAYTYTYLVASTKVLQVSVVAKLPITWVE